VLENPVVQLVVARLCICYNRILALAKTFWNLKLSQKLKLFEFLYSNNVQSLFYFFRQRFQYAGEAYVVVKKGAIFWHSRRVSCGTSPLSSFLKYLSASSKLAPSAPTRIHKKV
jgi:hypothetical protein